MKRFEFFYDYACPYAYLAHTQIDALAARAGAEVVRRPMLLGGVFKAVGTPQVPELSTPKARLNALDMYRWADHFGVPLVMPPTHPNRTVLALRATLAAGDDLARASRALFAAYWSHGRDVSDPEVVRAALDGAELDGAKLVARAEEAELKDALRGRTADAVSRGVFGAPAFIVDRELIWGQDRLHHVERALGGREPDELPPASEPGGVIEFYFDFSSPFSYLAATQIRRIADKHRATLVYKPFLLGALFKEIGTPNVPLFAMSEAKREHSFADVPRWASLYGIPFRFPSNFPMNTVKSLRMALVASEAARSTWIDAAFRAYWVDDRDLADDATLVAIANDAGLDGAALLAATQTDEVKAELKRATSDARAAGLCGAPSFVVRTPWASPLFWGQDRLVFVEKTLSGWRPPG